MALVWSINERASHGCPRISESQNNQNQLSLPPIILVSYKHTRLAQNTFERERGVRKNETGAGVTTNFVNRWRCGQRHKIRGREGVKTKQEKSKRNNASLVEPVATKCSFNYQAQSNRVSTSQSLKSHFITIQKVQFPHHQTILPKSVFFHQSCVFHQKPKTVFFRQPSSEQSQRKAEWPPWDLRLFSMANLFNSTHECLGQKNHQRVYYTSVNWGVVVKRIRLPKAKVFLSINFFVVWV